jgi:hypothetical protein
VSGQRRAGVGMRRRMTGADRGAEEEDAVGWRRGRGGGGRDGRCGGGGASGPRRPGQ